MKNVISNLKIQYLFLAITLFATTLTAQKKSLSVTCDILIDAPIYEVYTTLKSLEDFNQWSPFVVEDPSQINYVEGENGQVGSIFYWEGVEEKSQGSQRLAELKENEYVKMNCDITKPFKGQPIFEYYLSQTEEGILVRQDFKLPMKRFPLFMAKLFGAKKDVRNTNQLGLQRLKEYIETSQAITVSLN